MAERQDTSSVVVVAWFVSLAGVAGVVASIMGGPWWLFVGGGAAAAVLPVVLLLRARQGLVLVAAVAVVTALAVAWSLVAGPPGRGEALTDGPVDWARTTSDLIVADQRDGPLLVLDRGTGQRLASISTVGGVPSSGVRLSDAGWVMVATDPVGLGGLSVHDRRGRVVVDRTERAAGARDLEALEVSAVAADDEQVVLLACETGRAPTPAEQVERCVVESWGADGELRWTTPLDGTDWRSSLTLGPNELPQGADVPDTSALWLHDDVADRSLRLDAEDGAVLDRAPDAIVTVLAGAPVLRVDDPRGACEVTATRGDEVLWRRSLAGTGCPLPSSTSVQGGTLYVGSSAVDVDTGRSALLPDDTEEGAQPSPTRASDLVLDVGARGWVVDPVTRRVGWTFGSDVLVEGSMSGLAVVSDGGTVAVRVATLSEDPFVRRAGFDSPGPSRRAGLLQMAPVGADRVEHTCVIADAATLEAVLGPGHVLVGDSDGLREVRCE